MSVRSDLRLKFTESRLTSNAGLEIFRHYIRRGGRSAVLRRHLDPQISGDFQTVALVRLILAMLTVGGGRLRHIESRQRSLMPSGLAGTDQNTSSGRRTRDGVCRHFDGWGVESSTLAGVSRACWRDRVVARAAPAIGKPVRFSALRTHGARSSVDGSDSAMRSTVWHAPCYLPLRVRALPCGTEQAPRSDRIDPGFVQRIRQID